MNNKLSLDTCSKSREDYQKLYLSGLSIILIPQEQITGL